MSFQAYLDAIEKQTGKTPREFMQLAEKKGFTKQSKSSDIAAWLKTEYDLGHGHAMALVYVMKNGPAISDKHVGSNGVHRDESNTLRIDGMNLETKKSAE